MSIGFLGGLVVGSFIGSIITIFLAALAFASSDYREHKNKEKQEEQEQNE